MVPQCRPAIISRTGSLLLAGFSRQEKREVNEYLGLDGSQCKLCKNRFFPFSQRTILILFNIQHTKMTVDHKNNITDNMTCIFITLLLILVFCIMIFIIQLEALTNINMILELLPSNQPSNTTLNT